MTDPLRVLIIDDHTMFREGVRSRLATEPDIEVVGEASSAQEALALVESERPTIVILDIRLPDISGIELARRLRDGWPELNILVLSGYDFEQYVRAFARIGIQGYMLKDARQESLIQALRDIGAGGVVLPPQIASKVMRNYRTDSVGAAASRLWELTIREIEVLELLQRGLRNAKIGELLAISPRTVETHVHSIISKLGAESRTDAVRIGLDQNLIR